ncbi:potassium channel family protein [Mycoplasmopsis gallinacea]|uniref:Potassium uptake protein A n=1 Tax=Mycoplasmopsis gallinacea TaxID=29556 RepID=A0A449A444_9BACT|nr:TrkA family potassium uptake protein [Mycoplasmopsis gallinacea]VEU59017.1 potassium uptake protein A [Mycoplasmopsis gallinacea]
MKLKYSNDICVIGTGRFGSAVIEQLLRMNKNILLIDREEENVKTYNSEVDHIIIADATDTRALKGAGVDQVETVVVAVSDNIEIIAALKELRVKNIIARSKSRNHARVLKQIGVNIIVSPEHEAGVRTALIAANTNFIKYSKNLQEIGNNFVFGTTSLHNPDLFNKKLSQLNFNEREITAVLVKRNSTPMRPTGDLELFENDQITIVGQVDNVTEAFEWFNEK